MSKEVRVTKEMVEAFEKEFYADKGYGPEGRGTKQAIRDALRIVLEMAARG